MVDQLCFHCGEPGHHTSSCLIRTTHGQTAKGREAFKRYIKRKRELAKQLHRRRHCSSSIDDDDDYVVKDDRHFHKVIQWMKEVATCGLDDDSIIEARDPFALLKAEEEEQFNTLNNNNDNTITQQQQQRWDELHRAKRKHIDRGHRQEFNRIIDNIRCLLTNTLGVTSEDILQSQWQEELTQAVVLGRPANFSSSDVENEEPGGRCLKVYTVEKLHARCRQLHHLAFNDDEFAGRVRSLLLPIPIQSSSLNDTTCDNSSVNMISLGGGPGYDHVAMCLVAKFLHDIQPQRSMMRRRSIRTQVFDLFDKDWEPIMITVSDCLEQSLADGNNNNSEIRDGNAHSNSEMTMHHADIRLGIEDTSNADLAQALESVNIIAVQFCLHENASFLVEDYANGGDGNEDPKQQRLGGVMKDIFHHAPKGTTMIVTDSSNTLFPPLKSTANEYGWVYLGDEEMRKDGRKLSFLGPKSYVMLHRT